MENSIKLKLNLLYNPAIPVLVIYPKEIKLSQRNIFTFMFIEALFTIAKVWKKKKLCPSMDEWLKKTMVYEYYGILFNLKKE